MTANDPQRPIDPEPEQVDKSVRSEPVETEHGEVTVAQQPTGARNEVGGGEFPNPETTPALHDPEADPTEDTAETIADGSGEITGHPRRVGG